MHRWAIDACPGSVLAEAEAGPNEDTFDSKEGTAAHILGEQCVYSGLPTEYYLDHIINEVKVDDQMISFIQDYVDFILAFPGERLLEWKFFLNEIHELCHSTLDHASIDWESRVAYLTDLKYGRVYVPAVNNRQLLYYAVALVIKYQLVGKIDTLYLSIYQPRVWGKIEPTEVWAVTPEYILEWAESTLKPSILQALDPNAPRRAGTHCRDCRAKLTCSSFLQSAHAINGYTVPLTDAHVAQVLDMEKPLEKLVKSAQSEAVIRLMAGRNIPGYKPIRAYGKSKIYNETACADELKRAGLSDDQIYKTELKGITELKKIKVAKPIVTSYVDRPQGGIKAVPLSASQPAVATAASMFNQP